MYKRYGLTENPFNWREALDDPARFLIVEGFGEQKPIIDGFTKDKFTKSLFFLIHGNSGTGRTSVSNYVAHVFANGAKPLKIDYDVRDSAHKVSFHEWVESFALVAGMEGFPEIETYFTEVGTVNEATTAKYVKFLFKSLRELKAKNRPLVALFENVKNSQLFDTARMVFDSRLGGIPLPDIPLVIFTSSDEEVSNGFGKLNPKPEGPDPIKLRALTGTDVLELVKQKWVTTSTSHPHPFDPNAIVKVFDFPKYPLKRVIEALHSILEAKLNGLPPGDDWPVNNQLAINRTEIAEALLQFVLETRTG